MPIENTAQHPSQPIAEVDDDSFVRFAASTTPSAMPLLKLVAQHVIDRGIVRLGSCSITSVR